VYGSCRPSAVADFQLRPSACNRLHWRHRVLDESEPATTQHQQNWSALVFRPATNVRDLGIYLDADLSMRTYIYSYMYSFEKFDKTQTITVKTSEYKIWCEWIKSLLKWVLYKLNMRSFYQVQSVRVSRMPQRMNLAGECDTNQYMSLWHVLMFLCPKPKVITHDQYL